MGFRGLFARGAGAGGTPETPATTAAETLAGTVPPAEPEVAPTPTQEPSKAIMLPGAYNGVVEALGQLPNGGDRAGLQVNPTGDDPAARILHLMTERRVGGTHPDALTLSALGLAALAVNKIADVAEAYAPGSTNNDGKPATPAETGHRQNILPLVSGQPLPPGYSIYEGAPATPPKHRRWLPWAAGISALAAAGSVGFVASRGAPEDSQSVTPPAAPASLGLKGIDTSGSVVPVTVEPINRYGGTASGRINFDFAPGKPTKKFDSLNGAITEPDRAGLSATANLEVSLSFSTTKDDKGGVAGITVEKDASGKPQGTTVDISRITVMPVVDLEQLAKDATNPPICSPDMNWPDPLTSALVDKGILPSPTDPAILPYAKDSADKAAMYEKFVVDTCKKQQLNTLNTLAAAGLYTLFDETKNGAAVVKDVETAISRAYDFSDTVKWGSVITYDPEGIKKFLQENAKTAPRQFREAQDVTTDTTRIASDGGKPVIDYTIGRSADGFNGEAKK
ncbi:MAG: hypothetical protein WBP03_04185 [Candidatus Saccharimonadales bacterium]